jgi:hypothetical protein
MIPFPQQSSTPTHLHAAVHHRGVVGGQLGIGQGSVIPRAVTTVGNTNGQSEGLDPPRVVALREHSVVGQRPRLDAQDDARHQRPDHHHHHRHSPPRHAAPLIAHITFEIPPRRECRGKAERRESRSKSVHILILQEREIRIPIQMIKIYARGEENAPMERESERRIHQRDHAAPPGPQARPREHTRGLEHQSPNTGRTTQPMPPRQRPPQGGIHLEVLAQEDPLQGIPVPPPPPRVRQLAPRRAGIGQTQRCADQLEWPGGVRPPAPECAVRGRQRQDEQHLVGPERGLCPDRGAPRHWPVHSRLTTVTMLPEWDT